MTHDRSKAINLLKTAQGQINAAIRMAEEDRYCVDVMNQIDASIALLKKANLMILEDHMNTCVISSFNEGKQDEKIGEIMQLLKKYYKS